MSWTGGAGVVCILIFREGLRHHELGWFGMWGTEEGSGWLGEAVKRERGAQGGALLGQE
jgi:hypothetical protein